MAACLPSLLGSGGLVAARPALLVSAACQPHHALSSSASFLSHRGLTMHPQVTQIAHGSSPVFAFQVKAQEGQVVSVEEPAGAAPSAPYREQPRENWAPTRMPEGDYSGNGQMGRFNSRTKSVSVRNVGSRTLQYNSSASNDGLQGSEQYRRSASTPFRTSREFSSSALLDRFDDNESGGPIELPPREIQIDPFAIPEASPAQIVASICLTGAIVVLSYRALRKRAARSKEMQFRSSGIQPTPKSIKEEARKTVLDNLTKAPEVPTPPPSAAQTAFGAIVAGVIAFGLYKFTSSVEAGFSVKAVSQDYSIRNLTITVRTIITGLCYLATFVFAANSIGLTLYAFQLLLGIGIPDPIPPSDSESDKTGEAEDYSDK